ncbi:uncharacterized protein LOC129779213 isoform X2 [Toxorhynchites rutilus septentrionalis]|uniref:uncharacterized protein LOC129779213 isoform X2 n=1 Tax=Toxorhynchites rutilus septentrionalis TaxID=329112 RepID=UPI0024793FA6|nr:uncharacterized protein LOC129779213 isoform X2 [Toxorhynchites rutilus septentrionalis]
MLKSTFVILLILGSCFADIATWNSDRTEFNLNNNLDKIKGQHYSQHEASVHAARKGAAERLARISAGSGGTQCGTACYSSSGFSDNSDTETLGQGIVGFTSGSTGSGSSSAKYQSSSSNYEAAAAAYPVAESSKSSYVRSSQRQSSSRVGSGSNYIAATDGLKTRSGYGSDSDATVVQSIVVSAYPIGQESVHSSYVGANRDASSGIYAVPVDSTGSYRTRTSYTSASGRDSSSLVQPSVPVYTAGDHSSKFVASGQDSHQRYTPSNTYVVYRKPVPVYAPVSSDAVVYTPVKVVYPARTSTQYSEAEEQQQQQSFSTVAVPQPQPVYSTSASNRAALSSSNYRSSAGYRPVYQPIYSNHLGSDRAEESQLRLTESVAPVAVVPAPIIGSSSSSNRHEERHEDYSRKGSVYVPVSVNTGAAKYSAHDQHQIHSGSSYGPIAPVGGSTSESSSKYAGHEQQKSTSSYIPVVVQPAGTSSSSSSQYSAQEQHQRHQKLAGDSYYPVSNAGYTGSRYSAHDAQSAYRQQQAVKGGNYGPYPITDDALGRRFGATGAELGAGADLGGLMSEAERLAKLQAKNAYNGAVSGSSAIDTENRFSGSSDSANNDNTLGGGFQRTKSWSSSSKWASGQKYGDDGKIKSYSSLSTAESEQHNINGKKTGYKAATSTLEDDGKVSTYSLHTP